MNNRLYCTFTNIDNVDKALNIIKTSYVILFNKIFVLESLDEEKIMLTYNVDMNNTSMDSMVDNTILVHRKKQTHRICKELILFVLFLNNPVSFLSYEC